MARRHFRPGDWVIYCVSKQGTHPGPRAENIHPNEHGDTCSYTVDKYWLVLGEEPEGTVLLATRTGKQHRVSADDLNLRPARWWERWWYRSRFPQQPGKVPVG